MRGVPAHLTFLIWVLDMYYELQNEITHSVTWGVWYHEYEDPFRSPGPPPNAQVHINYNHLIAYWHTGF